MARGEVAHGARVVGERVELVVREPLEETLALRACGLLLGARRGRRAASFGSGADARGGEREAHRPTAQHSPVVKAHERVVGAEREQVRLHRVHCNALAFRGRANVCVQID